MRASTGPGTASSGHNRESFDSNVSDDEIDGHRRRNGTDEEALMSPPRPHRHSRSGTFLGSLFGWFSSSSSSHDFQRLSSDENVEHDGSNPRKSSAGQNMSVRDTVRTIAMTSKLNLLLIFVPVGIVFNFLPFMPAVIIFACNTIALVPLSSLLAYATECIASELGDTIGALINISLGNLIELITLFVALKDGKVHIVQGALVGSILVNLLLVLGVAIMVGDFFAAELEQQFDVSHAQALACLLALSVVSILIPIGFHYSMDEPDAARYAVLSMSRISAVILLFVYVVYVFFLLRPRRRVASAALENGTTSINRDIPTVQVSDGSRAPASRTIKFAEDNRRAQHRRTESIELGHITGHQRSGSRVQNEDSDSEDSTSSSSSHGHSKDRDGSTVTQGQRDIPAGPSHVPQSRSRSRSLTMPGAQHMDLVGRYMRSDSLSNDPSDTFSNTPSASAVRRPLSQRTSIDAVSSVSYPNNAAHTATSLVAGLAQPLEDDLPPISRNASFLLLGVASIVTAICAEFIVSNIEEVTADTGFSKAFIGLIVLPIAGNAAEFITALSVAAVGKADLALGVSFGSSIQIALFATPVMILSGWALNEDMTLDFGMFDTIALIGSTLVVNVLITNGRSNYLEGCLLCACYMLVAVGAFLSP